MQKHAIPALICASLISVSAGAQRIPDVRRAPASSGGQDLTTSGADRPSSNHAPRGFEAERLARARRQAQFNHEFPGTPLRPLADVPAARRQGGTSNGAL